MQEVHRDREHHIALLSTTALIPFSELAPMGVPFCRNHIRQLERRGQFPRHVQIGEKRIAWVRAEVLDWIAGRIQMRDAA